MEEWRAKLAAGDIDAAWMSFIACYQRLIIATIRRVVSNEDDVADLFPEICGALAEDDLALLKRHNDSGKARFSTWLVTVVHRRAIDWVRHREGRVRRRPPPGLTPVQQRIFQHLFIERRSHIEGYEVMHQRSDPDLSFGDYLKDVAETYRSVARASSHVAGSAEAQSLSEDTLIAPNVEEEIASAELASQLAAALTVLRPEDRLAVKLFIVDELPAERVARILRWPNSKAVYNRVHRALVVLRKHLETTEASQRTPR